MIKDAIANIARDRILPSFPATTAFKISVISESPERMCRVGTKFDPVKKGLGTVDVNVLYHSLFESASPQWVLSALFGSDRGHPREAVGFVNTCPLIRIYVIRLLPIASDSPAMLEGSWGDSNRNSGCVAVALRIPTKSGTAGNEPEIRSYSAGS